MKIVAIKPKTHTHVVHDEGGGGRELARGAALSH